MAPGRGAAGDGAGGDRGALGRGAARPGRPAQPRARRRRPRDAAARLEHVRGRAHRRRPRDPRADDPDAALAVHRSPASGPRSGGRSAGRCRSGWGSTSRSCSLAVIALVQLRLYGAPITRTARGALGVDPLLVAAPAIGLLAGRRPRGAPRPAAGRARGARPVRGRRLVPALAGRQVARRPLRYTRAALLLILAAALGTFASAHAATWTRSQGDQASYAAGADVRLTPDPQGAVPPWGLGDALRAVPGVTAATPVEDGSIQLGTTLRDGELLGIDGAAMADIVRLRDDEQGRRRSPRCARSGDAAASRARDPDPGGDAPALAGRGLGVRADRGLRAVPRRRDRPRLRAARARRGRPDRAPPGRHRRRSARTACASWSPLAGPDGAGLALPATIVGIQLDVTPGGNLEVAESGTVDVAVARGEPRRRRATPGRRSRSRAAGPVIAQGGSSRRSTRRRPLPERVEHRRPVRHGERTLPAAARRRATPAPAAILVNDAFLDRTGAAVGDTLQASVFGVPLDVGILGHDRRLPDPRPGQAVRARGRARRWASLRLAAQVASAETAEWWLATRAGTERGGGAGPRGRPDRGDRRRGPDGRRGRPRGGPARAGRHRDPRARVARGARVRRHRLPRERQRVARPSAWASSRCSRRWGSRRGSSSRGSRSRTSCCSSSG